MVTPEGVRPALVRVHRGKIESIAVYEGTNDPSEDLGDLVLLPGMVDSHVHINEPGRTDWEGFATATRAAAAGGITTLVDMPLNSIPATTRVAALALKRSAAAGQLRVDVGFWGGVVPGNEDEIEPLWRAGVLGFKCFLVPSGVDEFEALSTADLERSMPILSRLGAPLLVHAESPGEIERAAHAQTVGDPRQYAHYLLTRPPEAEAMAIAEIARLALRHGTRVHIVHVSSIAGLAEIRRARAEGARISAETCPHYLSFSAEEIPDGATELKCAPPIREAKHREGLWNALAEGHLELIASDHSPSPPELKNRDEGNFLSAWGGIASLQVALAAAWTGARQRGHALTQIARWMSLEPARLAGLDRRKGAIAPSLDADLVVFDPDRRFTVHGSDLEHRHPLTPYEGRELTGVTVRTYVRGQLVYDEGRFPSPPIGELLSR